MSPGFWQILLVVVVALVLFGPKRLPNLGKSMGEAIRGFKKGLTEDDSIDVTNSVENGRIPDAQKAAQTAEEKDKSKA
jgi:sec-independent protein translocase protein TatA